MRGKRITVLYVEDDPINQQVLHSIMSQHDDIDLLLASDEADVDDELEGRTTMPDVVLMDSQLTNTTGSQVRRRPCNCVACVAIQYTSLCAAPCCGVDLHHSADICTFLAGDRGHAQQVWQLLPFRYLHCQI